MTIQNRMNPIALYVLQRNYVFLPQALVQGADDPQVVNRGLATKSATKC
jgi:hypothetical protein